ncbi:MAG: HEAT repeat domain-containing protein [Candidatus Heimdallarchaeota archaeon]|nr:HEAT repeat domain-containing protein [Candidatus Heimdallarchaeota archaeon]MCK4955715.1 HEAT repeat domain-containing protein [Candidatus Heimdallarchaeota archaeon]
MTSNECTKLELTLKKFLLELLQLHEFVNLRVYLEELSETTTTIDFLQNIGELLAVNDIHLKVNTIKLMGLLNHEIYMVCSDYDLVFFYSCKDREEIIPEVTKFLHKYLHAETPDVREEIFRSLGKLGDLQVIQPLLKSVRHGSAEEKKEALEKLGESYNFLAIKPMLDQMTTKDLETTRLVLENINKIYYNNNRYVFYTLETGFDEIIEIIGKEEFLRFLNAKKLFQTVSNNITITEMIREFGDIDNQTIISIVLQVFYRPISGTDFILVPNLKNYYSSIDSLVKLIKKEPTLVKEARTETDTLLNNKNVRFLLDATDYHSLNIKEIEPHLILQEELKKFKQKLMEDFTEINPIRVIRNFKYYTDSDKAEAIKYLERLMTYNLKDKVLSDKEIGFSICNQYTSYNSYDSTVSLEEILISFLKIYKNEKIS